MLLQMAYVALGGAIGSMLRFLMVTGIGVWLGREFPYGTLTVNILGSFLMGVLVAAVAKFMPDQNMVVLFCGVGVLGGFTTFSSFSLDIWALVERGATIPAFLYIISSVLLSVLGLVAGMYLVRAVSA